MRLFTEHPKKVGETYIQHFFMASRFGLSMTVGGIACMLHGFFPFLFEKTGSHLIRRLYFSMVANRADLIDQDKIEYLPEYVI